MRTITDLQTLPHHELLLSFDNGEKKRFDMKPYLKLPVFKELQNEGYFRQVQNRSYFIEWPHEQDLSSDTLYLEGTVL